MNDGHLVVAYHGCDISIRDGLVSGRLKPRQSSNQYDWLGPGFYLFEGDEDRAIAFARAAADEPARHLTARPIATPTVVGCVFSVQRCLDMTTRVGRLEFERAYVKFEEGYRQSGQKMPVNMPAHDGDEEILLRGLDRAVFSFIHAARLEAHGTEYFQAVRGAFRQGSELAPNSGFHRDSHVQIALRDFSCVKGWFLPPGQSQLTDADLTTAEAALKEVRRANPKPRRRA